MWRRTTEVSDMMKRIDMYVTGGGRVLRRSDKLKSCGVSDGCTIRDMSRMRRGGRHKDKKSKVDRRAITRSERSEQLEGDSIRECDKDAVIRMLVETEGYRETIDREMTLKRDVG